MATIASKEEDIDLQEVKIPQAAAPQVPGDKLREEVEELREKIREDFADVSGEGYAEQEGGLEEYQEYQVEQLVEEPFEELVGNPVEVPVEVLVEEPVGQLIEPSPAVEVSSAGNQNDTVQLESVSTEELVDLTGQQGAEVFSPELAQVINDGEHSFDNRDTSLDEEEIEVALGENTSDIEEIEAEIANSDDNSGVDPGLYFKTPILITPPEYIGSGSISLYGPSGIIESLPEKDTSLDQVFIILRDYFIDIPAEKELFLNISQLDLQLGEDNIYCNDTTIIDLLRLLDTCDDIPPTLEIKLELHDRFISKLNALFDILNDLPPTKRRRTTLDSDGSVPAEAGESENTSL